MGAQLGRVITNYRGLVETCRERADELGLSRAEIDRLGGLPSGHAGRLLGRGIGPHSKRMWPISLELMLGVLGLKLIAVEDAAATARTLALREPVDRSQQRFGDSHWRTRMLPAPSDTGLQLETEEATAA
jgi:hypothetical protein